MPISFGESSGGGGAYIRVNMPQNRWSFNSDGGSQEIDMARGMMIDIKNVRFGWLLIDVGRRDWQPWPSPHQQLPKPSDEYKQGFEVDCWLPDGSHATFSNNSFGTGQFIAKLYNQAEAAAEFAQGMVPVVQVTSSTPVQVGKGTSYDLGFTIAKWMPKPSGDAVAPATAPLTAPATAPSEIPGMNREPAPAAAGNDFGF